MLELIIVTIILVLGFIGAAWYTRYRSQQRSAAFEGKARDVELNVDSQYLDEQLERQEKQRLGDLGPAKNAIDNDSNIILSISTISEAEKRGVDNIDDVKVEQNSPNFTQQAELDLAPSSEPFISPAVTAQPTDKVARVDEKAEPDQELESDSATTNQAKPSHQAKDKQWDIVLALTILAGENRPFVGEDIRAALDFADLEPGDMQIYHRHIAGQQGQSLFSVANLLSPGTLKPETLATLQTKGLVIFMRLPNPANGLLSFDAMLDAADKMAKRLGGRLCDEQRQTLTEATLETMRGRIFNFNVTQQGDN